MAWLAGPVEKDTYGWGRVVPKSLYDQEGLGFWFADFCGDEVKCVPGGPTLKPHEVAFYEVWIDPPPRHKGASHEAMKRLSA